MHHVKHGLGHLIIHPPSVHSTSDSPIPARITFTTIRHVSASRNISVDGEKDPFKGDLTILIDDVIGLKKEGMNLPGRVATGWALDTQAAGGTGLEMQIIRRDKPATEEGVMTGGRVETVRFKGIVRRNELFDRLLSLGKQRWETL